MPRKAVGQTKKKKKDQGKSGVCVTQKASAKNIQNFKGRWEMKGERMHITRSSKLVDRDQILEKGFLGKTYEQKIIQEDDVHQFPK